MPLEIVPSIDLRAGRVVRLKQGDYGRQINYDVDPLDVARSYADAGATWLHIVDLDRAFGDGENSAVIRERACRDAAWLGVELDPTANAAGGPRISAPGARASAWAIPTNEELMIARHTRRLLR